MHMPTTDCETPVSSNLAISTRYTARFWQRDHATAAKRRRYIQTLVSGGVLTWLAVWGVLSIYWGALWRVTSKVNGMNGWVVDFDGGIIGETVSTALMNLTGNQQLSWSSVSSDSFPNGAPDVAHAIVQNEAWAIVTINSGASVNLSRATASANSAYNGSLAVTIYASEARNENSYPTLLLPNIEIPLQRAAIRFASQNAAKLAYSSNVTTLLSVAPGVITRPFFYTVENVRPFDVIVATAIDFVGMIYLLIISFIVTLMNYNARAESGISLHLQLRSLLIVRVVAPILIYFFLSLFYSLISIFFQAPFDRRFGRAGFVIYWMLSFCAMSALGLAVEALVTILTPKFIPFFLILWIISNVSVSYYPIEVLPNVFRYGYATPFYNVSSAVRAIIFSTRNQLGLNFSVLIGWIVVSCCTMTLAQTCIRRKEEKQFKREHSVDDKHIQDGC